MTQKSKTIHCKTYTATQSAQTRKIHDWRLAAYSLFYELNDKFWKSYVLQIKPTDFSKLPTKMPEFIKFFFKSPVLYLNVLLTLPWSHNTFTLNYIFKVTYPNLKMMLPKYGSF